MASNKSPKCSCPTCNNVGVYAFPIRRRGGGNAFLCEWHLNRLHSYSFENPVWSGTKKAHGFTVSHELETMAPTKLARCEFLVEEYFPTSDCTVDVEFKSPIYRGFNSISAYASTIEYLRNNGEIVLNNKCGLHTHVGHETMINSASMAYIRRFYHSLFLPLYNAWRENRAVTCQLFGRYNTEYVSYLRDYNGDECEHSLAINIQHEPTIEWRQPRFQTAEQYIACLHYIKASMQIIVDTFIPALVDARLCRYDENRVIRAIGDISEKRKDYEYNEGIARLTLEQKQICKKAADKTAQKLVKLWHKTASEAVNLRWEGFVGGQTNYEICSF